MATLKKIMERHMRGRGQHIYVKEWAIGEDIRHISLGLYQFLCLHVVGTEDTVRTKRLWNALRDRVFSYLNVSIITSGSFGEGLEMKGSDIDYMYVFRDVETFNELTDIQQHPAPAYFHIITDDTKPGFVKLLLKSSKINFFNVSCEKVGNDFYLSNALFKMNIFMMCPGFSVVEKIHGPCLSDNEGLFDTAFCLRYKLWISQANQWISRPNHAWPSDELKTRIIEHGVLFVPIGVKGSPNESIEWRISFSVGEKILIYSFTHTQLLCYALMKIVLKDLINTDPECEDLLCSYFIKNIIFWISEEFPLSMWRPENLVPCFMRCFERLIYCVEYSMCIHYFIPENNMFENRIEGEKRRILLAKLNELHSYNWQCILLSPQLQNFHHDCLRFEAQLNDTSTCFEQIMHSNVVWSSLLMDGYLSYCRLIGSWQCNRSTFIRHSILRLIADVCSKEAQTVQICSTNSNKKLYRHFKTCQHYIVQSLYLDAVSGWLMVSSMFYKMKQYHKALDILSYALEKCSPDKSFIGNKLSSVQRELLRTDVLTSIGLVKALNVLHLNHVSFCPKSSLIPNELEIEVTKYIHKFPPVVYGQFLSFLCFYHLHDMRKCRDSLTDIKLTISHEYFTGTSCNKAASYNCLGVAFQLIGEIESARQAFMMSVEFDSSRFNNALQRLSVTVGL